jgi:hypothetical protein
MAFKNGTFLAIRLLNSIRPIASETRKLSKRNNFMGLFKNAPFTAMEVISTINTSVNVPSNLSKIMHAIECSFFPVLFEA